MSPVICAHHIRSNTTLLGSVSHIRLLEENGYNVSAGNLDKWCYAELRNLDKGVGDLENFSFISNFEADDDLKFRLFDKLCRCCETAERLIEHVKSHNGYMDSLNSLLTRDATKKLGELVTTDKSMTDAWCEIFSVKENRIHTWRR
jgi:hypothetical protein